MSSFLLELTEVSGKEWEVRRINVSWLNATLFGHSALVTDQIRKSTEVLPSQRHEDDFKELHSKEPRSSLQRRTFAMRFLLERLRQLGRMQAKLDYP